MAQILGLRGVGADLLRNIYDRAYSIENPASSMVNLMVQSILMFQMSTNLNSTCPRSFTIPFKTLINLTPVSESWHTVI